MRTINYINNKSIKLKITYINYSPKFLYRVQIFKKLKLMKFKKTTG